MMIYDTKTRQHKFTPCICEGDVERLYAKELSES